MDLHYRSYLAYYSFVRSGSQITTINPTSTDQAIAIAIAVDDAKSDIPIRSYEEFEKKINLLKQSA